MICRCGARAPDLRLWRYSLIVRAVTTCVHAHAQAREHKRRVVTVTTSVGTVEMMSGLSRDPEKKKRLPVRTSDLSTSGASASLFMDACRSTSNPAISSTWRVDDRVSGRNIPYPHATTHAHVSIQSITLRLQLTPIAHTFSTADLPVRSCVSEEVESAHVAVSLIPSICCRNTVMHRACA